MFAHCSRDLSTFLGSLNQINCFKDLGKELSSDISVIVRKYLHVTGYQSASIKIAKDWEEAQIAAKSAKNLNLKGSSELEARKFLREQAAAIHSPKNCNDSLNRAFAQISTMSSRITINTPIELSSVPENDFLPKAAAGAVAEATYDNVLWFLAEASPDHPARLKFILFAKGRWPIGLKEQNFYLW